nr:hypothetical protein PPFHPHBJ_00039 [Cydia pomonella granulovirus]WOZ44815.1 hypothetical protein HDNAPKKO_00041 [Cydia pomonella granulovirus]WOZ44951.1 hypothetical protein GGGKFHNK_00039 [Cydia pomonella granulovirus]WOZ45087.1 hypothetical protein BGFFOGFG_00039 [Cydia pomonella granulovirus]WOZ45608.1 hypothetical protein AAGMHLIN_00037 [Cydia pomonella granulovirus]
MVRTPDGALYTGMSNNVHRRFVTHCIGRGARREVVRLEKRIKKLSKTAKERIVSEQPKIPISQPTVRNL